MYLEKFWNFLMLLEFHELEYYKKLDFSTLEYLKSDKSQHIFETVIDCNIIYKKSTIGPFLPRKSTKENFNSYS